MTDNGKNGTIRRPAGRDWTRMGRDDFGQGAAPEQGALFAVPAPDGAAPLFGDAFGLDDGDAR